MKYKASTFEWTQIKELTKDPHFQYSISKGRADTWSIFLLIVRNFLGNYEVDNYSELVEIIRFSFRPLGCKMSIKVHYLLSHLVCFSENFRNQRFHQDSRTMEDTGDTGTAK